MPEPSTARPLVALVVDLGLVLLFATVGRISHEEGLTASGVLGVAWPFAVALLVGWLLAHRRSGWPVRLSGAVTVWLVTAVLGLALRVATGGGFAWSFGVVTLVVLGVFLVGWRGAATALATIRAGRRGSRDGRASAGLP